MSLRQSIYCRVIRILSRKFLLEDVPLNMELIAIYKKIYDAIRKRIGNDKYNDMIAYWDDNGPMFPVNGGFLNWSNNNSMQTFENGNSINPYLLRQINRRVRLRSYHNIIICRFS